ncbi:serine protease [Nostoc sphaeroides CHAB 2801]|uniref:S1 family peptidase n=1 Tax=Nostoc sphaeroides TaxID=446679 RepID=UPI0015F34913|nr:serine protease [Nostoc sphaeroides]MCC5634036.1 serine protease [Nostoc sphaeroides CHAB 2801]
MKPTKALAKSLIREKAEKVTVFISRGGQQLGSGVIIGQNGKTVYVLTASHVIGIRPGKVDTGNGTLETENPYEVTTNNGQKFKVGYSNYKIIVNPFSNNIDLAILKLDTSSKNIYKDEVAKLTSSLKKNMPVYIFGYLPCSPSAKVNKGKQDQFSNGKIFPVTSSSQFDSSDKLGGYDVNYNNNTIQGMSGSPVFDAAGRVVAIHAKTDKKKTYNSEVCLPLPSEPTPDYGDNSGISIKTFANLKSDWPDGLQSILEIDSSPVEEVKPDEPTPSPNPTQTTRREENCPPFIQPGEDCPGR